MNERPLINRTAQKSIRQFLRANQTPAEAILWQFLRRKDLGEKFVRQHGIEKFVVDFCCRKRKLVIEIDGGIHNEKNTAEFDAERQSHLEEFGFTVIRFKNEEILNNLESVIRKIKSLLN